MNCYVGPKHCRGCARTFNSTVFSAGWPVDARNDASKYEENMSKVFIIGAAGKVGRHLVRKLAERGHEALAMYRNPEQKDELAALGGKAIYGDLLALDENALAGL